VILVSLALRDTEYLADGYFPELSLQVTVARWHRGYVFYADTLGIAIDSLRWAGKRLSPAQMHALFPSHPDTRLSLIAVHNTDVGAGAVRSRSLTARSLVETTSFMGEDLHVVARAAGVAGGSGSRYVGFSRSRVRDGGGNVCSIDSFCGWTDALAIQLSSGLATYDYLARFSSAIAEPLDATPVNVLLDLNAVHGSFARSDGIEIDALEDICSDAVATGTSGRYTWQFPILLAGNQVVVGIRYDPGRSAYEIVSEELARFVDRANPRITLVAALNRDQAFRIITGTPGVAYVAGDFYDIAGSGRLARLKLAALSLLHPVPELANIHSEKGAPPSPGGGARWSAGSLFDFIDQEVQASAGRRRPFGDRFDHLVCDDLNDEAADFVGLQDGAAPKIAFIHAKAKTADPGAGASNLYDVCSQAAKNLVYIRFGARPLPSNTRKWNSLWSLNTYVVRERIRCGGLASAALRTRIEKSLQNPGTTREVWVVLGSILSKAALESSLAARSSKPHAIQAAYLLMSLDSACKSVGVQLKVFCAP
jgi:hypothetical protein